MNMKNFAGKIYGFVILASVFSVLAAGAAFAQSKGVIMGDAVNIRSAASLDSSVITRLDTGCAVEVVSKEGDFYRLSGDYDGAYVSALYLDIVTAEGIFTADGAGIMSSASDGAEVLGQGAMGDPVEIVGADGGWYIINYNGQNAFVSKDLVLSHRLAEFISGDTAAAKPVELQWRPDGGLANAQEIIDYAKQFLGTPYAYAGTNLTKGVDCSGFVYSVMKNFDISLNRSSGSQSQNGFAVGRDELSMGDLVFFDTNGGANRGNISHVGIYIGDGQFIHSASSSKTWGVTISSLSEDYYNRNYVSACRVLE